MGISVYDWSERTNLNEFVSICKTADIEYSSESSHYVYIRTFGMHWIPKKLIKYVRGNIRVPYWKIEELMWQVNNLKPKCKGDKLCLLK